MPAKLIVCCLAAIVLLSACNERRTDRDDPPAIGEGLVDALEDAEALNDTALERKAEADRRLERMESGEEP